MDLVLGLSLTSSAVRWVLVEGCAGEGDPVDRGELDIPTIDRLDAELLVHAVLNPDVVAEKRIRVVGVTATCGAGEAAAAIAGALVALGHHAVVQVPDRTAVAALAEGIANITGYDVVAVCIVEPESTFVALVDGADVTVEHVGRADPLAPALGGTPLGAVFVVGSDDLEPIVSSVAAVTEAPVFSAAEADLALARGAALAAARTYSLSPPVESAAPAPENVAP